MRIPGTSLSSLTLPQASGPSASREISPDRLPAAATLTLSENAQLYATAAKALAGTPPERADRIASLRQQIATGSYAIDREQLCDRLLSGPLQGGKG